MTGPSASIHRPLSDASDARAVLDAAVRAADTKQGEEVVALDVSKLLDVVDYFMIVSGRNARQVAALVEEIEAGVKVAVGRPPLRVEGLRDASWVLMDYGDVVVHVFLDETRRYYDLEHLWLAAPRVAFDGVGDPRSSTARR
jgi:ribosome-associated protein